MGQQQLLVLVFSIVVVGGIVIVGTYAIRGETQLQNRDFVFRDAFSIITDVQLWKLKPLEIGGGLGAEGFKGITFRNLGYSHILLSNRVHRTDYGCYQLQTTREDHHALLLISSPSCAIGDYVAHVVIRGLGPDNLDWQHAPPTTFKILK